MFGDLLSGAKHSANFTLVVSDHDQPDVLIQRSYEDRNKKDGNTEDRITEDSNTEDRNTKDRYIEDIEDTAHLVDEHNKSMKACLIQPDIIL